MPKRRSREGAWIEIFSILLTSLLQLRRSREGAWIEISVPLPAIVSSSRSREGAWIEILTVLSLAYLARVAPVRERGLKYFWHHKLHAVGTRRSREGAWIEMGS